MISTPSTPISRRPFASHSAVRAMSPAWAGSALMLGIRRTSINSCRNRSPLAREYCRAASLVDAMALTPLSLLLRASLEVHRRPWPQRNTDEVPEHEEDGPEDQVD